MEYKSTLNLPKTDFPMKANLPVMEEDILKFWNEMDIYNAILEERKNSELFVLHDGPPYANGHIHIGTAFNKILKDFIVKYKNIRGFRTPYVPGWDCHGMPIEHNVTKELGQKLKEVSKLELRKKCREYADKYVNIQKSEFRRLGVFGDWEDPYITMSNLYESDIIDNFGKMVEKGFIYRGLRPIHWCMRCQTALAGNEIEYEDKNAPAVFVKFKMKDFDKYFLIWTTTPWTLPANMAVAMNPGEDYIEVSSSHGNLIFMKKLLPYVTEKLNDQSMKIVKESKADFYLGAQYHRPMNPQEFGKVIYADFVTTDTGTGIVHIAPGHGYDDYQAGIKYNLDIVSPVMKDGKFDETVPLYAGMNVFKANDVIIEDLKKQGMLIFNETFSHSYPVCWRCKSELIFRATEQWFLNIEHDNLRDRLKEEIDKTRWIPGWSRDRIYNMVATRPDWCLSRQRSWGVPIPVLYCKKCGKAHIKKITIDKVRDKVLEFGSDIWFEKDINFLVGSIKCEFCGSEEFDKEENIFDVWFDSALSHSAVVKKRKELRWPSDLYLEAVDQHRGWFQVSLIVSTATDSKAPYKEVLTHGLILDKNMKKMSKSLGNVFSPEMICKKYGAEIIRLWFASIDYTSDAPFGEELLKTSLDTYFKIRNTIRFMLGNLSDNDMSGIKIKREEMHLLDRYILSKTAKLKKQIFVYYDDYEFHKVFKEYYNFIVNDLSSFYLDVLKDRLYTQGKNSAERLSGLYTVYLMLDNMIKFIAPILPFTAEQAYMHFNKEGKKKSVHQEVIDNSLDEFEDEYLEADFKAILSIREKTMLALEFLRNSGKIGKSIEANIVLYTENSETKKLLEKYHEILPQIFIVSNVEISNEDIKEANAIDESVGLKIYAYKAEGEKCSRCWLYLDSVGKDLEHPELCEKCVDVIKSEV